MGSLGFNFTIPGWSVSDEGAKQNRRSPCHLIDGLVKCAKVLRGGLRKSANLLHELHSRRPDFVAGGRRIEIVKLFDIPAHFIFLFGGHPRPLAGEKPPAPYYQND
jgi:hypothetical protein